MIDAYGHTQNLVFDMSMVRGLNYYTGIVMEANLTDPVEASEVGSIAGGGRYNELVNVFCEGDFPCTGASVGFERIFSYLLMKQKKKDGLAQKSGTQVIVCEVGPKNRPNMITDRIKILKQLRESGVAGEILHKSFPT